MSQSQGEMQDAELERWKREQVQKAEDRLHRVQQVIRDREAQSEEVSKRREAEREQKLDEDKRLVQRATRDAWQLDQHFFFLLLMLLDMHFSHLKRLIFQKSIGNSTPEEMELEQQAVLEKRHQNRLAQAQWVQEANENKQKGGEMRQRRIAEEQQILQDYVELPS